MDLELIGPCSYPACHAWLNSLEEVGSQLEYLSRGCENKFTGEGNESQKDMQSRTGPALTRNLLSPLEQASDPYCFNFNLASAA
jgi:hypothetical protein